MCIKQKPKGQGFIVNVHVTNHQIKKNSIARTRRGPRALLLVPPVQSEPCTNFAAALPPL